METTGKKKRGRKPKTSGLLVFPKTRVEHKAKATQKHDTYVYECGQCDKLFETMKELKSHFYQHHTALKTVPPEDELESDNISSDHVISSDDDDSGSDEVSVSDARFSCEYCGKLSKSKAALEAHLRVHTNERPFPCTQCPKAYKTQNELKLHVRKHTGDKPFECPDCGKTFSIQRSMLDHQRRHNKAFRYYCEVVGCGKGFVTRQDRDRHEIRGHVPAEERPEEERVSCHICDKLLAHQGLLADHLRTHTKEEPYSCHLCGKGFKQASNLRVHLKSKKHNNNEQHTRENPDSGGAPSKPQGKRRGRKPKAQTTHDTPPNLQAQNHTPAPCVPAGLEPPHLIPQQHQYSTPQLPVNPVPVPQHHPHQMFGLPSAEQQHVFNNNPNNLLYRSQMQPHPIGNNNGVLQLTTITLHDAFHNPSFS